MVSGLRTSDSNISGKVRGRDNRRPAQVEERGAMMNDLLVSAKAVILALTYDSVRYNGTDEVRTLTSFEHIMATAYQVNQRIPNRSQKSYDAEVSVTWA